MFYDIEDADRSKTRLKTQRKILAAALELFAADGIGRTSMVDISEAADITRRTCYNYFETKECIARELHRLLLTEIIESCRIDRACFTPSYASARDYLKSIVEAVYRDRRFLHLIIRFDNFAQENPSVIDDDNLFVEYLLKNSDLSWIIKQLYQARMLKKLFSEPEGYADVILNSLMAYFERVSFRMPIHEKEGFIKKENTELLFSMLLSGINSKISQPGGQI